LVLTNTRPGHDVCLGEDLLERAKFEAAAMIGFDDCGGARQRLLRESRNEAWTPVYMAARQVSAVDWAVFRGRRASFMR
jgi:hypothetical protein